MAKCITIKQPWASLICAGVKDIENRSWPTKYRGRVLIHSSASPVKGLPSEVLNPLQYAEVFTSGNLDSLTGPNGAIIGSVAIIDCVVNHESVWAEKTPMLHLGKLTVECQAPIYNWVLENPIMFDEPIPAKGKLSFWEYEFGEEHYECTNNQPTAHQSCGEKEGCRQDCSNCDFNQLKFEV